MPSPASRSYVLVPLLAGSSTSRSCQFWQLPELPILATPRTAKVGKSWNCRSWKLPKLATPRNCQSWQLPELPKLASPGTAKVGNSQKLPKLATPRNCQSWQLPETAKVGNSQKLPKLATPRNCQSWQLPEIASFGIFCNWQMAKRSEQVLFIHFLLDFLLTKISKIGHFLTIHKAAKIGNAKTAKFGKFVPCRRYSSKPAFCQFWILLTPPNVATFGVPVDITNRGYFRTPPNVATFGIPMEMSNNGNFWHSMYCQMWQHLKYQ